MLSNFNIENALKEAVNSSTGRPEISKFQAVSNFINSNQTCIPQYIDSLKSKLTKENSQKTKLLSLELIEFTSSYCSQALISEYNRKSFLQIVNSILVDQSTEPAVKLKAINLIQFFKIYFEKKSHEYPNFDWYYSTVLKKGIRMPPYDGPNYLKLKNNNDGSIIGGLDEKQKKLFEDLKVVYENVLLANSMINEKELVATNEVMYNLKVMEKKLLSLPDRLLQAKEDFLYKFALAVIEDIGLTIDRHYKLTSKLTVQPFDSKSRKVLLEGSKSQKKSSLSPKPKRPDQGNNNSPNQGSEVGRNSLDNESNVRKTPSLSPNKQTVSNAQKQTNIYDLDFTGTPPPLKFNQDSGPQLKPSFSFGVGGYESDIGKTKNDPGNMTDFDFNFSPNAQSNVNKSQNQTNFSFNQTTPAISNDMQLHPTIVQGVSFVRGKSETSPTKNKLFN